MPMLKIIRKIGKILRGGAGRKEILLGTLCGVLIGFNPGMNLTLLLAVLLTLLLNANVSFTILGAAIGKVLCLVLSPLTFHTGYFIIHNLGAENLFVGLVNAPVTALMDLNVYAMIGSLPYALVIGFAVGTVLGSSIVRIRKKMLEADQHEIIGKTFGNKYARFLLRLAFGKSRLSLDDEVIKKSPLFRKSGLILTGAVLVIGLLLEFLLLDLMVKGGLQSALSSATGAEVNIGRAHLSLAGGTLELDDLQVTDPDKPTHNLVQLDTLAIDVSIHDLLRRNYVIERMEGQTLKRDVLRKSPGKVYHRPEEEADEEEAEEAPGKALDQYFARAADWKKYGEKTSEYLENRRKNIVSNARGERPEPSREAAVADARQLGYLKASADLAADRPAWTIRQIRIDDVLLGGDFLPQRLEAKEVSSHPELNERRPTAFSLTPIDGGAPLVKIVLRYDRPDAANALTANIENITLGDGIKTSDSFPVNIQGGHADLQADGTFTKTAIAIPFTVRVHDLQTEVKPGQQVLGMDADTAREVLNSIEQLDIEGSVTGPLALPRLEIDYEKLTAEIREALVAAGKEELSRRANEEMDKARDEFETRAGEELDKAIQGEEAEEIKSKAGDALKKLF